VSAAAIRIGTSGWHYPHWRGPFYPADLPPAEMLAYYAQRLDTVEVNNSFYRLPEEDTLVAWRDATAEDFLFAVKASRYITHMKKLKEPEESISNFMERAGGLGDRLGPVLFQLPPRWKANPERLATFLEALPAGHDYVFEFRDHSWFDERVYDLLRQHGAGLCIHDMDGQLTPKIVTSPLIYVRFHGPGRRYAGKYSSDELRRWADAFSGWTAEGRTVHCYFNNDELGYAIENARDLRELLDGAPQ
jgi:uncharacterized protein YecE (DUF72 family)